MTATERSVSEAFILPCMVNACGMYPIELSVAVVTQSLYSLSTHTATLNRLEMSQFLSDDDVLRTAITRQRSVAKCICNRLL